MEQKHGEGFDWTPAQINLLRQLKSRQYSATQIAKQIGCGLTRNAVIGKLHRLGLSGRQSPKAGKQRQASTGYAEASDAGNKGKGKVLDLSPPERLDVRRFSWERADDQPNP